MLPWKRLGFDGSGGGGGGGGFSSGGWVFSFVEFCRGPGLELQLLRRDFGTHEQPYRAVRRQTGKLPVTQAAISSSLVVEIIGVGEAVLTPTSVDQDHHG